MAVNKASDAQGSTPTATPLYPVLDHLRCHRRQVKDLAGLSTDDVCVPKVPSTALTVRGCMIEHLDALMFVKSRE